MGESDAVKELLRVIAQAAPSNGRVLITGENGTGKELVARGIHQQSLRSGGPFVEVNCAAIPEELIESELFGHAKGSFTGATASRKGKFEIADGGTLFLDEIGDMTLKTQAKVLRALQEQKIEPVGGSAGVNVDVRVIAATNKNLEDEIRKGTFREDLYFRLNVIPIHVIPLRERRSDIPMLVRHFSREYAAEYGRHIKDYSPAAMEMLVGARLAGERARAAEHGRAPGHHGQGRCRRSERSRGAALAPRGRGDDAAPPRRPRPTFRREPAASRRRSSTSKPWPSPARTSSAATSRRNTKPATAT